MLKISFKNVLSLILYAIPNTIFNFGILYIINSVISGEESLFEEHTGLVFLSVVIITYLLNIIFQKKLNKYTFNVLYKNEIKVFDKILKTPLLTLEKLGAQRFYTTVEDLRIFAFLSESVTHTVNALLMLLLCIAYLFVLSVPSALIVVGLIIVLTGFYFLVIKTMSRKVARLREYNEHYYKYVNDVIKGFRELKLSLRRRTNLMDKYLEPNRREAKDLDFNISYTFLSINIISQYGLYLVVGIVLFLLPQIGLLEGEEVISYIVILLFTASPVNILVNMQNMFTRFSVANTRIKKFLKDFDAAETETLPQKSIPSGFNSLTFKDICFSYNDAVSERAFALGPVNITLHQGETIFIIGGNGSGKSTFINILTGLYTPSKGTILLNGHQEIDIRTGFQEHIAAIFTENHIFSHNYDDYSIENNKKYRELLKLMELDTVIEDDKETSARRGFSKGQSKRMSMIFALLENSPVLVLDEWAADQDPYFRKYFYEQLVPKLKQDGKTIIAVTHDDAYFKYADRIIKFEYGKIVNDFKATDTTPKFQALP